ncbi:hypothetical protein P4U65_32385 [Bacillus pacificus]|nr:hypothetical protein [Bacillus thuringiensis]MED1305104.1 hypothetical protein [Bacillus pacificus]
MDRLFVLELLEHENESGIYGVFVNEEEAIEKGKELIALPENDYWWYAVESYPYFK